MLISSFTYLMILNRFLMLKHQVDLAATIAWPTGRLAIGSQDFPGFHQLFESAQVNGHLFLGSFTEQFGNCRAERSCRWRVFHLHANDGAAPAVSAFEMHSSDSINIRALE